MAIDTTQDFEVTFDFVESILRTLPISYYCGRDIDVTLSATAQTSVYNSREDTITVAYGNILSMLANLKSVENIESYVRDELYHEISHAIMTPTELFREAHPLISRDIRLAHDIANTFEDERIETVLKDTYYGVNFKESIIALNNWDGKRPPVDALDAFYQTVRFRTGEPEYVKRVADIINIHRGITKYNTNQYMDKAYLEDVSKLFWDIAKDWMEENQKDKLDEECGGEGSYDKESETGKGQAVKSAVEKQAAENGGPGQGTSSESGMGGTIVITKFDGGGKNSGTSVIIEGPHGPQGHGSETEDGKSGEEIVLSPDQIKEIADKIEAAMEEDDPKPAKIQDILSTELNKFVDDTLTSRISDVFENFLSRHKNNSSAMMRYSGVMDPRLLATRDDWRIWKYKAVTGPIKGYDKLHLNLFIDTSGSYRNNEKKTNTILKTLDTLEHKYPFFSFDLVTCQVSETLRDKKQRYIEAYGGNRLDDKIWDIYSKLQYHDSFNYNIILFDGDAFTDCGWNSVEKYKKNFGAFNSSKCSIISDEDNKDAIEKYAPQAHTILVKNSYYGGTGKSYAEMLFDNILEAMNKALL